jgi:hypothetical protein
LVETDFAAVRLPLDFFALRFLAAGFFVADFVALRDALLPPMDFDAVIATIPPGAPGPAETMKITGTLPTKPSFPSTRIKALLPNPLLARKLVAAAKGSFSPCRASRVPLSRDTPELTFNVPVVIMFAP